MKKSQISLTGLLSFLILFHLATASGLRAQVDRGAAVPDQALTGALKGMEIKDYFVPSPRNRVGVIHALSGTVVVIHRATKEAYFGKPGDAVFENDALNTLQDSRCRIRFLNSDVVTMAQDTQFGVDEYSDRKEEGKKSSLFSMIKGKAMFYAMRLFRYKDTRFRLKTPTAIVGVRGTQFGAHVYSLDKEKTADSGIRVADSGNEIGMYLAQAGPGGGARSFTDAFSVDGVLEILDAVTRTLTAVVPPGNLFSQITGRVVPTPPGVILDFQYETEVSTEKREEVKKTAEREQVQETTLSTTLQRQSTELDPNKKGSSVDQTVTDILANVTQVETGTRTEETSPSVQEYPTRFRGYFSAILGYKSSPSIQDVYVSTSLQDFHGRVRAYGLVSDTSYLDAEDIGRLIVTPYAREVFLDPNSSGDPGTSNPINYTEIGHNSYQAWGHWTMSSSITVAGTEYVIDTKGYYILGEETLSDVVADFKGTYNYSGDAWGTYWSADGGTDMTGTFNCTVNFASPGDVTDFDLSVSGGNKSASITDAKGSFSGSHFTIDKTTGTWTLTGGTPPSSYRRAVGSLYGPDGKYIGGAWGMKYDCDNAAEGIFQGSRP